MTGPLSWLDRPATDRGIRFLNASGEWDFWSYERMGGLVRRTAGALRASGVGAGDVVAVVEPTGPHAVGLLFGTMLSGAAVAPLPPPATFTDPDRYAEHLRAALATTGPSLVVCERGLAARVAPCTPVPVVASTDLLGRSTGNTGADGPSHPLPSAPALVQCTSGTTGAVRAVRVPMGALAANTAAIRDWLEMTPDDPTASWLPVHHDMGLVGCLVTPVATGADLWLLPPTEFVRRPLRYLECFGRHGARLTAMPAFGLDHIVRRVPPAALAGLDFSAWRAVIVGAERIAPRSLRAFADLCGPHGLRRESLLPAYGLAEATLAVTGLPLRTGWTDAPGPGGGPVVGCGPPLGDARVAIVDDRGVPVADGEPGEIVVRGGGVTVDTALHTGDAGFVHDGQLYVLGRLGDSRKVRGRSVFAEDLDAALVAALDVPPGRVATVLGGDVAVVVLERPDPRWLPAVPALLRPHLDGVPVLALDVPLGTVPRTTSGKPRRRALWQAYVSGRLGRAAAPATR